MSQLRSFREVCRLGGYAPAARVLLLTTPAVWEQVKALEHYYGVRLLEREGSGVRPTAQGERLLDLIGPHLAGLDSTRDALQQEGGIPPQQLVLVTNLRVLAEEVARAARRFRGGCPGVRLKLLYTGSDEIERRVKAGEADVAFTLEPGPDRPHPAAAYEPAGEVEFLLIAPARHPVLGRKALTLAEVVRHPLVLAEPGAYSRRRVQEAFHQHDLTARADVVAETSSDEYTLACVRAGLGIGVTVGTGRGHLDRGLGVRPLRRWLGAARVGFLWPRGAHVPPAQRGLADAIRDELAAAPGAADPA